MQSSPGSRTNEIGSHIAIIVVTVANLIFITFFHEYIAWYTIGADGSVTRLPLLTDGYFTWLPIPVTASIVAIVAFALMIIYDRYWFRTAAEMIVIIIGIAVVGSLLYIFPFDFSVIPNATAVDVAPVVVTVFLILMAAIYAVSAVVLFVRSIRSHAVKKETR
jgi:magnesium-transporting ATPase (P-type)